MYCRGLGTTCSRHSFPTRRSSDLLQPEPQHEARTGNARGGRRKDDGSGGFVAVGNWKRAGSAGAARTLPNFVLWCHYFRRTMTSMTSFPGNSVIFVQSRASAGRAVAIARGDDCSGRRKDDDDGGFLVVTDWKLTGSAGPLRCRRTLHFGVTGSSQQ